MKVVALILIKTALNCLQSHYNVILQTPKTRDKRLKHCIHLKALRKHT